MDEARAVLARLERIDALGRERAPARELLDELRSLVGEAEAWARAEGDERARTAAERCEEAITAGEEAVPARL
jgi:hypothetical protein